MNLDALRSNVFITSQTYQNWPGDVIPGHSSQMWSCSDSVMN